MRRRRRKLKDLEDRKRLCKALDPITVVDRINNISCDRGNFNQTSYTAHRSADQLPRGNSLAVLGRLLLFAILIEIDNGLFKAIIIVHKVTRAAAVPGINTYYRPLSAAIYI